MLRKIEKYFVALLVIVLVALIGMVLPALAASPGAQVAPPLSEVAAQALTVASFMAIIANRLVAGLVEPLFDKLKLDKFYLMYVSWVAGGLLVWVAHVNIFIEYVPDPLIGQILTALVAGGGANMLHDFLDRP